MIERGDEIAAIILEPIPHNIGAVVPARVPRALRRTHPSTARCSSSTR